MDEIRKRAYKIFQERQGGSAIGDWQKAEASVSADAAHTDTKSDDNPIAQKADAAKPDAPKGDASDGHAAKASDAPKADAG